MPEAGNGGRKEASLGRQTVNLGTSGSRSRGSGGGKEGVGKNLKLVYKESNLSP